MGAHVFERVKLVNLKVVCSMRKISLHTVCRGALFDFNAFSYRGSGSIVYCWVCYYKRRRYSAFWIVICCHYGHCCACICGELSFYARVTFCVWCNESDVLSCWCKYTGVFPVKKSRKSSRPMFWFTVNITLTCN